MTSLSDRFVDALRTFDADAMTELLAPDAVGWLNTSDRERPAAEIIATLRIERTIVRTSSLHVRHQSATDDGFVVQFVFDGTTQGGTEFRVPICIVAHVVDGRIGGFEEYANESAVQPLTTEFLAAVALDTPQS